MMKIKCKMCKIKEVKFDSENAMVCITCFPAYVNKLGSIALLSCEEKGHTNNFCGCPNREYKVTAADFPLEEPKPGKTVEEFLKGITNEKDRLKLQAFFDRQRIRDRQ